MVSLRNHGLSRRAFLAGGAKMGGGTLLLGGITGAVPLRAAGQDKTTVELSYLWAGPEGEALEAIVAAFNASQDQIEVKGTSNPVTQRQLAAMASSNGFDISDNFANNTGSWAAKGILEPLDDFVNADAFDLADFVPATLEQLRYDGKLYALPIAVHTLQLLYNKDLFAEAGIAEPPATISQWADAIAKLTKVDADGTITQLGLNVGVDAPITWTWSFGGRWVDEQGQPTATDPANLACINSLLENVYNKYGVDQVKRFQSGFGEYASPQNPFYVGKVAMVVDGEWQSRFVQQYAPDLNWGVAPLPVPDDRPELAGASDLSASMFFIPRNAKHKQEAWQFMRYLMSSEPMWDFTLALANLPARLSLASDPGYAELPNYSGWLESLSNPNLRSFPSTEWSAEYRTELASALDGVFNGNASPDEAMADVQGKAEDLAS